MKGVIAILIVLSIFLFSTSITFAGLNEGLVAHYTFDGNTNDASVNGNDGARDGAIWTTDRFGHDDSALSFDGTDDAIIINDSESLNFNDDNLLTVSAWVNLASYEHTEYDRIVGHYSANGNEREYYLGITPENPISDANLFVFAVSSDGTSGHEIYSQTHFELSVWYHVVGIYDGAFIRLYANRIEEASSAYTAGIYNGTTTAGYNITSGEMGHLFYVGLGNDGWYDTSGNPTGCSSGSPWFCFNNRGEL